MKRDAVGILVCFAFLAVLGYVVDQIVIGYPQNPYAFDILASEEGIPLYRENCAACHGERAEGGTAPALDYTGVYRYGSSDWEKFQNVRQGITATGMTSFSELTDDEIWKILGYVNNVDYVRHPEDAEAEAALEREAAEAAAALEGEITEAEEAAAETQQ